MADVPLNQTSPQAGEEGIGMMPNAPASMFTKIQQVMMENRRLLMLVAGTLMLVGFLSLVLWSSDTPYRPVYTGMNEKDAAAIVEILQKEHIPYKLEGAGTVLVPTEQVYTARLKLASEDMMPGVGTGFEIFDRASEFGVSDFTQKINLQRALQGELARTIEVLPQITAARVHLVMPKTSAFAERDRKASASVMLQMMGGRHLPPAKVIAIQNLVAASIPELNKADVTVVDSSGNLLTSKEQSQGMGQGQNMESFQTNLEKRLAVRLKTMLEQVVGAGQAVVRVSASITREYVEQNSKRYNPDEQVLRSQKTNEEKRNSTQGLPQGVPGVASNTPGQNPQANNAQAASETASKREVVNNYEISSTSEHKVIPFGNIKRLSVAVIVGGTFKEADDGSKIFVPRSKAELKSLSLLAQRAVGYDEDRGDTVELQSMPLLDFSNHDDEDALKAEENKAFYFELGRYALAALALFFIAWFLLRPLARRLTPEPKEDFAEPEGVLGGVSGNLTAEMSQIDKARRAVSSDPERAEKVLREWVGTTS
ncbi:MAG: flagellar basal-body MS-ring/collar protein FliF [Mariprofundaceae bacterium]|nr:flagellar basal-body MS-ring/collar protein FliF [Mariprofundaceae bacterium]